MEFDATFLIAVISFVIFTFIMNKIFYAPILNIMQKRQEFVEENFNSAKIIKKEAEEQSNYRNEELEKSRDEARLKISTQSQKLKQERSNTIAEYKNELFKNVEAEKENLKNSAAAASEIINDNIVDIAKEISGKLLGKDINPEIINKSQIKEEKA